MARIRTIKPDFWSDEKIVELTPWARLLFIALWNFSDDEGRMPLSHKKIKMLVFPGDDVDVPSCLEELSREQLIQVYEGGGRRYLAIRNFAVHQRIEKKTASKLPSPEDAPTSPELPRPLDDDSGTHGERSVSLPEASTESSPSIPEVLPEDSVTEGNGMEGIKEGKGTSAPSQAPAKTVDPRFHSLVDLIHDRYKTINKTDCPWSAKDGKQAKDLLASLDPKDWTIAKLDRAIQFKLLSFDRSASEAPHRWLADLAKYYEAPLDRFGRPDFEKRDRWLRKHEAPDPVKPPTPNRIFRPDAEVQAFVDTLPRDPWKLITERTQKNVDANTFDTWFAPTRFAGVDGAMLIVRVPNAEFNHIGDRYGEKLFTAIEELKFPFTDVEFWSEP